MENQWIWDMGYAFASAAFMIDEFAGRGILPNGGYRR